MSADKPNDEWSHNCEYLLKEDDAPAYIVSVVLAMSTPE